MKDWSLSGLSKLSYIDTGSLIMVEWKLFNNAKTIGQLTDLDQIGLADFIGM